MSENWRLWSEFQPAEGTGEDRQASRWITATLREMSVADRLVERLLQDLSESALAVDRESNCMQFCSCCQILVPLDWQPGDCRSQDWAYFWVTRTAAGPGLGDDDRRVIQLFLFPAAKG